MSQSSPNSLLMPPPRTTRLEPFPRGGEITSYKALGIYMNKCSTTGVHFDATDPYCRGMVFVKHVQSIVDEILNKQDRGTLVQFNKLTFEDKERFHKRCQKTFGEEGLKQYDGGWPAAIIAQIYLRHKIQNERTAFLAAMRKKGGLTRKEATVQWNKKKAERRTRAAALVEDEATGLEKVTVPRSISTSFCIEISLK
jgi:hypothetical protein